MVAEEFLETFGLANSREYIEAHFERNRGASWRRALDGRLRAVLSENAGEFERAVREKLKGRLED